MKDNILNEIEEPRELVTQGFIFNIVDGKASVLACKRGKAARSECGKWCIPGGHIERGESLETCVSREVREETNVEIKAEDWNLYGIISDPDDNPKQIICVSYYTKVDGNVTSLDCSNKNCPDEISEVKFISLDYLEDYDWAFNKQKIIGMIRDVYEKL